MATALKWLTYIGELVGQYIGLPSSQQLPAWTIGLMAVVIAAYIFKIVTHVAFKVILWISLVILVIILLQSFNVPILQNLTS